MLACWHVGMVAWWHVGAAVFAVGDSFAVECKRVIHILELENKRKSKPHATLFCESLLEGNETDLWQISVYQVCKKKTALLLYMTACVNGHG
jgi:hypothetical protein